MQRLYILALSLICLLPGIATAERHTVDDVENVQLMDAHRYTSNPDGILSDETVVALDRACDSLRMSGLAQVAIVALDEITPNDVFTFAHSLFSKWGVGSSESNNGLGILLVRSEREIRFVTGDGLEGVMTDAMSKRIQQTCMVGPFSEGDYDLGMIQGMAAISSIIHSGGEPSSDEEDSDSVLVIVLVATFAAALMLFILAWVIGYYSRVCPKCGRHSMKVVSTDRIRREPGFTVVRRTRVCTKCGYSDTSDESVNVNSDGPRAGGFGGGMIHGGFGGGHFGGGFGGGHFGGGGAGSKF